MIRLAIGSFAAAAAMFITGFIFYATPLQYIAAGRVNEIQSAAIQSTLAANLPATGTYMIPDTSTPGGTVMYGKGPVATIHYNTHGYSLADMNVLVAGFVHEFFVCLILAGALSTIAPRITDFGTRARAVILFAVAGSALMHLGEPIWYHHDWPHFLYLFVADTAMIVVAGLILARWFLPRSSEEREQTSG